MNKELTADEMFKQLEYEKDKYKSDTITYFNKYNGKFIWLDKSREEFGSLIGFTVQELQAINKKVEELGWIK